MDRAIAWAARRTDGDLATLWIIEGVATYGARLAAGLTRSGYEVVEAARMDARAHRGTGKSDPLDSRRIAAAVLSLEPAQLRRPRSDDGARAALRILVTAREHMSTDRTATINALIALLRVGDLGIDARKSLTANQISEVARWRARSEDLATLAARAEAVRLAKRVVALNEDLGVNHTQMIGLIRDSKAAELLKQDRHRPGHRRGRLRGLVPLRPGPFRSRIRCPGPASIRSPPRPATPPATDSTAAVTVGSTEPCTWRPSLA